MLRTLLRHRRPLLWSLFVLALLLRTGYVFGVVGDDGFPQGVEYYPFAENLAAGRGYFQDFPQYGYTLYSRRPPLLPLILAALNVVFGDAYKWAGRAVYVLASAATVPVAYLLARQLYNRPVALLAAALMAVNPEATYYCIQLNPAILMMLLTALWLLFVLRAARGGRPLDLLLGALFLGLSLLLRPHFLYFVPVIAAYFCFRLPRARAAGAVLVLLAVLGALLAPWALRTWRLHGTPMLGPTLVWREFVVANNPRAVNNPLGFVMDEVDEELYRLGEAEVDRLMFARGMQFVREHPGMFLELCCDRFVRLWRFYPHLEFVGWSYAAIMLVSYGLFVPFMLWGLVAAARRRWRTHLLLWLLLLYYSAVCSIVVSYTRYRLTLQALLLTFAAAGLCAAWQAWQRRRARA